MSAGAGGKRLESHLELRFDYVFFPELCLPHADRQLPGCYSTTRRLKPGANDRPGRHTRSVHDSRPTGELKYSLETGAHSMDYGIVIPWVRFSACRPAGWCPAGRENLRRAELRGVL